MGGRPLAQRHRGHDEARERNDVGQLGAMG